MRKVLLRIVFDEFWELRAAANELLVGAGWVLLLWCLIALVGLAVHWNRTRDGREVLTALMFWGVIPLALAGIPLVAKSIAAAGIPVFGYGFMLFVGFASGTLLALHHARRIGMDPGVVGDLMMWLLIPGLIGGRTFYVVQYADVVFRGVHGIGTLAAFLSLWDGGLVFYGSVTGGVIGGLIFCRNRKLRPLLLADVVAPSILLGLGFGRIGCFLYGCCYGGPCDLPWAVQFPPDSATYAAQLRAGIIQHGAVATTLLHPAQLYSSAFAFVLAGILIWCFRRRPFEGFVAGMALTLYPVNRFCLELIRTDEPGQFGTLFTISQLISIGLFTGGIVLLVVRTLQHQASAAAACCAEPADWKARH